MELTEQEIIERYFAPLAGSEGLGLVDDAALIVPERGFDLVVTTDLVAEDVHFFADDPPAEIAAKALRVNLSDLAAKGAEPIGYTLDLALPARANEAWIAAFAEGLAVDQARFTVHLIGGDTARSRSGTVVTITAFGRVPAGTMVPRNGARPGDAVLVSGTIGDATLGLELRRGELPPIAAAAAQHLAHRFRFPEPRLSLAAVARRYASAAMDVSDGLAGDLAKLCRASGVSAEVGIDRVPLSGAARAVIAADSNWQERVLTGGDDYEILMTVAPEDIAATIAAAAEVEVALTDIGRVVEGGDPPAFLDADGKATRFLHMSYDHFGGPAGP